MSNKNAFSSPSLIKMTTYRSNIFSTTVHQEKRINNPKISTAKLVLPDYD